MLSILRPAEVIDVMDEQYAYLTNHLMSDCQATECGDCKRAIRLKDILLEPMQVMQRPGQSIAAKMAAAAGGQ